MSEIEWLSFEGFEGRNQLLLAVYIDLSSCLRLSNQHAL